MRSGSLTRKLLILIILFAYLDVYLGPPAVGGRRRSHLVSSIFSHREEATLVLGCLGSSNGTLLGGDFYFFLKSAQCPPGLVDNGGD